MLQWHFRSERAFDARAARAEFLQYLRFVCITGSDFEGAEIVFGELVANVVQHACGPIEVLAKTDATRSVMLYVWDTGPSFALQPQLPQDPGSDRGRGLFIVSTLCKNVAVRRASDGRNQVCVVLPVLARPAGSEPRVWAADGCAMRRMEA